MKTSNQHSNTTQGMATESVESALSHNATGHALTSIHKYHWKMDKALKISILEEQVKRLERIIKLIDENPWYEMGFDGPDGKIYETEIKKREIAAKRSEIDALKTPAHATQPQ